MQFDGNYTEPLPPYSTYILIAEYAATLFCWVRQVLFSLKI